MKATEKINAIATVIHSYGPEGMASRGCFGFRLEDGRELDWYCDGFKWEKMSRFDGVRVGATFHLSGFVYDEPNIVKRVKLTALVDEATRAFCG